MPSVLVLLAEGFEEIEFVTPVDLLRRAGVEVTTASLTNTIHVTGRSGLTLHADTTLSTLEPPLCDLIFLPGGPGVKNLRADLRVIPILKQYFEVGKWVTAICAAPVVLHDAGLLNGRRFTAHFSVASELPTALLGERLVIDGKLITSRGAGTALEFGLALVEALVSPAKRSEVAGSICY